MRHPALYSIGTAVPPHKIAQQSHYEILSAANGLNRAEQLLLKTIYAKCGIQYRHSVLEEFAHSDQPEHVIWHPAGEQASTPVARRMQVYEEYAGGLATRAVQDCLSKLPSVRPEHITHIITFSCTGMYAPGLDIELVEQFGFPRNAERTCINFMGCYAALNAMKSAYYIAKAEPEAVVLIAGVEICSIHYQKSNEANQMVANALFSDGSAAAIISAKELQPDREHPAFCMQTFYAEFEPNAASDMVWRIGNAGFDLRLTPEVPAVVNGNIKALVDRLLQKSGLQRADIDHYAIHPGGTKILEACETALELPEGANEQSYEVLRDYGNMSSVTVLFVLKSYMDRMSREEQDKKILACAFGPGITMESVILSTC